MEFENQTEADIAHERSPTRLQFSPQTPLGTVRGDRHSNALVEVGYALLLDQMPRLNQPTTTLINFLQQIQVSLFMSTKWVIGATAHDTLYLCRNSNFIVTILTTINYMLLWSAMGRSAFLVAFVCGIKSHRKQTPERASREWLLLAESFVWSSSFCWDQSLGYGIRFLIFASLISSCLATELDYITVVIAALSHDVGHPGRNNLYFINANDTLVRSARFQYILSSLPHYCCCDILIQAVLYNDLSVLENFHSYLTFKVLSQ